VKETSCESSDQLWLNCIPRWLREAADGVIDALDPKKTCLAHVGLYLGVFSCLGACSTCRRPGVGLKSWCGSTGWMFVCFHWL
jgi:hypothetical protein